MGDELFYVGIPDPDELRRYVLECSKSMIGMLKGYEEFNSIRDQKDEIEAEFNQTMKQILVLSNKIKQEFPEIGARLPIVKVEGTTERKARPKKAKAEKKLPKSNELDKLESEMAKIENKLKRIA